MNVCMPTRMYMYMYCYATVSGMNSTFQCLVHLVRYAYHYCKRIHMVREGSSLDVNSRARLYNTITHKIYTILCVVNVWYPSQTFTTHNIVHGDERRRSCWTIRPHSALSVQADKQGKLTSLKWRYLYTTRKIFFPWRVSDSRQALLNYLCICWYYMAHNYVSYLRHQCERNYENS